MIKSFYTLATFDPRLNFKMQNKEPSVCDEAVYNQLFRMYYSTATKYIYYKCGNLQQAEDIVQNVFIKVWRLCETIILSKAKSYIYTACNNSFLNEVAHRKVVLKHHDSIKEQSNLESPEFLIETEEFRIKLKQAINNLSTKEREVFLLSRIEQKTYKEIAEITGVSIKAIERRMSKALRYLRKTLGKHVKI